jgi:hypothetical protein
VILLNLKYFLLSKRLLLTGEAKFFLAKPKAPFTIRSIFGTARIKLVPVPLFCGTVPKIERSVNGADHLGSPRTKKVVRVPILSVPYQKLSVV